MVLPLVKFTEDEFLSFAVNEAFCCVVPGQIQHQRAEGDAPSFNKFVFSAVQNSCRPGSRKAAG